MNISSPVSMTRVASPFGVGDDLANRLPAHGPARERLKWLRDRKEELRAVQLTLSDRRQEAWIDKSRAAAQLQQFNDSYDGRVALRNDSDHPALISRRTQLERAERELAEIIPRLEQASEAWSAHAGLFERVEQYIRKLSDNVATFDGRTPKPRKGESASEAATRLRQRIAELQAEIDEVRQAPPPAAEVEDVLRAEIEKLAERGKPQVFVDGSVTMPHRIDFLPTAQGGISIRVDDAIALVAWLHKDALIAALSRQLDGNIDHSKALAAEQRAAKLSGLGSALLAVEREECELIFAGDSAVMPRPDADPRAVLALADTAPE
jgi:DNA repair exonuclease SbcCD ATPase subunit